jgi:hypothetical protein
MNNDASYNGIDISTHILDQQILSQDLMSQQESVHNLNNKENLILLEEEIFNNSKS